MVRFPPTFHIVDLTYLPVPDCSSPQMCTASVFDWIQTDEPCLYHSETSHKGNRFPVIFDSGASLAVSGFKEDFCGHIPRPSQTLSLGGMAQGMPIEGIGTVQWTFNTKNKEQVTIKTHCYYVPGTKVRLISPQRLFCEEKGITGNFSTLEHQAELTLNQVTLPIEYHERSHLPIGYASNSALDDHQVNLSILSEDNQNLTPSQKTLLSWHYRFGHKHMAFIQRIFRRLPSVFRGAAFTSASRCIIPQCTICHYAKAKT